MSLFTCHLSHVGRVVPRYACHTVAMLFTVSLCCPLWHYAAHCVVMLPTVSLCCPFCRQGCLFAGKVVIVAMLPTVSLCCPLCHMSHVTCYLSLVTCHLSHDTCHLLLVTCKLTAGYLLLFCLQYCPYACLIVDMLVTVSLCLPLCGKVAFLLAWLSLLLCLPHCGYVCQTVAKLATVSLCLPFCRQGCLFAMSHVTCPLSLITCYL